jgi:hypothetical protein
VAANSVFMREYAVFSMQPGINEGDVMNRTERAQRRRRMQHKIRETVALRRFTATLTREPEVSAEPCRVSEQASSHQA